MFGLDATVYEQICLTLLHSLWQVALLAFAAWLIGVCLGRRRDNISYAAHTVALVLGLIAVPITHAMLAYEESPPLVFTAPAKMQTAEVQPVVQDVEPANNPIPEFVASGPLVTATAGATADVASAEPVNSTAGRFAGRTLLPWLAVSYFLGVALMFARLLWSAFMMERLRAVAQPIVDGPVYKTLKETCRQLSIKALPAIAHAERVATPKVVGLLKPTILLPTSALTGLRTDELELILAHELAHIRRYDLWVNLLQRFVETLLFFNPAMWWLSRRVSMLREYCCDDRACEIARDVDEPRLRYAEALLRTVELTHVDTDGRLASLAASGRSASELRRRIARLFGDKVHEPIRVSRAGVAILLIGVISLLALPTIDSSSAADPQASEATSEKEDSSATQRESELQDTPPKNATDANRAVAEARSRTFGLQKTPRIAFQQVYQQAKVPGMQTHPDEGIASLWKARGAQITNAEFKRNHHEAKLAWEGGRLLLESFSRFRNNGSWRQIHYWDGKEGWIGEIQESKKETTKRVYRYADLGELTSFTMPYLYPQWAAAGGRLPWAGPAVLLDEHGVDTSLTHYQFVGRESIDGVVCDIYNGPERHERIWVARESKLVKAVSRHYVKNSSKINFLKISSAAAQREFQDMNAYRDWYAKQSNVKKETLNAKWSAATWEHTAPGNLTVFSDYREVSPGVQWPHQVDRVVVHPNQGKNKTFNYSLAKIAVKHQSEFDINEMATNALPDPGVKVTDRRAGLHNFEYEWSDRFGRGGGGSTS